LGFGAGDGGRRYDNRSTPRRFDVSIRLTGALDDEQLARLEKVAAACPLRRSIEAGVVFEERIETRQPDFSVLM
jgi:uncharacterized OsmC-like protein